jgi:hypothetical protein
MGVRKDTGMRGFNFNAPIADAGTSRHSFAGIQQSERGDAKNDNGRGGDKPERSRSVLRGVRPSLFRLGMAKFDVNAPMARPGSNPEA